MSWRGPTPNFHLNVVYSQPGPDDLPGRDYQHAGHVDLELLRRTVPHGGHQFYVCGPPPMMQSLVPALAEWGVAARDIHYEAFGPASVRTDRPARPSRPTAGRCGRGAVSALRSHAGVGRAGRQPARLCRAPRCGSRLWLSFGQLRQLRDEADLRHRALRAARRTTTSRRAIACCVSARRSRRWCSRPDDHDKPDC